MARRECFFARFGLQLVHHQACAVAGEGAMGLYHFMVEYSRLNELDGFVPRSICERGWSGKAIQNRKRIETLLSPGVGFIVPHRHDRLGDGYMILKYDEFNDLKAEIDARRQTSRVRKARFDAKKRNTKNADVTRYSPVPSLSLSVSLSEKDPLATEATEPRKLGSLDRYALAYAEGQTEASGQPFTPPSGNDAGPLGTMALTHAKGLRGEKLLAWYRETSAAYRRAQSGAAQFQGGFRPTKCLEWLNAGRPHASAMNGKYPVQQPAVNRCWEMPKPVNA